MGTRICRRFEWQTSFDTEMSDDYHARPMPHSLQSPLNLIKLATRGEELSGTLPLARMERLCGALESKDGEVEVEIEFGIDLQRIKYLAGQASVGLKLRCERCMQPMEWPITAEFRLGMIFSEAKELPESYEPLLMQPDQEIRLLSPIIEDELLLQMPMIALHPEGVCSPRAEGTVEVSDVKENPFAVLKQLK